MYEMLIEKLIKKDVSAIAGKVVDDTKDIMIPVSVVPPPPPDCVLYLTEVDCLAHGCYWWDGACHGEPKVPPEEFPWWVVPLVAAVAILGAVYVFGMLRK